MANSISRDDRRVLLWLIFFYRHARMEPTIVAELPKAKNGEVAAGEEGVVINVKKGSDGGAQVLKASGDPFHAIRSNGVLNRGLRPQRARKRIAKIRSDTGEPSVKTREITRVREAASAALNEDQQILVAVQQ